MMQTAGRQRTGQFCKMLMVSALQSNKNEYVEEGPKGQEIGGDPMLS
jgi:hypothetical protein